MNKKRNEHTARPSSEIAYFDRYYKVTFNYNKFQASEEIKHTAKQFMCQLKFDNNNISGRNN